VNDELASGENVGWGFFFGGLQDADALCGVAVDFNATQAVDGTKGDPREHFRVTGHRR